MLNNINPTYESETSLYLLLYKTEDNNNYYVKF